MTSMNSSSKSANSDSKPKRSFATMSNSHPSPSSVNSRNQGSRKKRKGNDPNQKTLGMAWGANSHSSSRSAFRNSNFPDFGSYMAIKNQKLHEQFGAEAANSSHSGCNSGKPIFQGVSIFVDGYTVPSHQELKSYMLLHGGRFQNYFSRHTVTHIICSNLPDSKIKNLRSFSRGLPIVKPSWVEDSVSAKKLLSWVPYQLDQIASNNQPKVLAFFDEKSCPVLNNVAECYSESVVSEPGRSSLEAKESEIKEIVKEFQSVSECPILATGSTDQRSMNIMENQHEVELDAQIGIEDGSNARCYPQTSLCPPFKSVRASSMDNSMNVETSNSKPIEPTSTGHSTLTDPNFVENYFKFSRLHFIGTWRNRYRKRYPSSSQGFKDTSSSRNISVSTQNTTIIHVDMDSFFVSVVIRNRPDLKDKPVAICHSDNPRGTAEISSASYPARDHGVKAGMFVRDAKALCPQLVTFPYNFDAYEEVADQFYDILHKHCNKVQAVSCDEAFIDVSDLGVEDPQLLAAAIRKEILDTTGCTASAGIAGNMLMARVATRAAKPDGCCYIPPEEVGNYLHELPVKSLPGIGHVLEEKLKGRQIRTCGQLRMISKESLQKDFGVKTGDMLWNYSRGIDNRLVGVDQEIKSVGAEVNWGVRLNTINDTKDFLLKLCKEVSLRLQGCGVQGRNITLKIKKRKGDAGEPVKYMGHGQCENLSRSITLPMATDDVEVLQRITIQLLGYFHIDARDIRGMGLQASKLEVGDNNIKRGHEKYSIRSWLVSSSAREALTVKDRGVEDQLRFDTMSPAQTETTGGGTSSVLNASLPSLDELDIGVIESLPPEVFAEMNDLYSGELKNLISKKKLKNLSTSMPLMVPHSIASFRGEERSTSDPLDKILSDAADEACNNIIVENSSKTAVQEGEQEKECVNENICLGSISFGGGSRSESVVLHVTDNLMPSSLSQVDPSVLQQLPEELRVDILESLPAHRSSHAPSNDVPVVCAQTAPTEFMQRDDLWNGNPPKWVEYLLGSSCRLLNIFAELYNSSCTGSQLSSIFQRIMSISPLPVDDMEDDAFNCLCELMKQYLRAKIETDIEEIYACSCLLRRLSSRSTLFLHIYNSILPHLQASVSEFYGGDLNIRAMD